MKLKRFSFVSLLVGALAFLVGLIVPMIAYAMHDGAIGIIGGADTPTYRFIVFQRMYGLPFIAILFGVTVVITALFCLIFPNTVKNNCSIKTTVLSMGISVVGALGLVCAFVWFSIVTFGKMSKFPIEYPASVLLGVLCFFAFIVLIVLYFKLRKTNLSIWGIIIDVVTSIVYLPVFFFAFSCLHGIIA